MLERHAVTQDQSSGVAAVTGGWWRAVVARTKRRPVVAATSIGASAAGAVTLVLSGGDQVYAAAGAVALAVSFAATRFLRRWTVHMLAQSVRAAVDEAGSHSERLALVKEAVKLAGGIDRGIKKERKG